MNFVCRFTGFAAIPALLLGLVTPALAQPGSGAPASLLSQNTGWAYTRTGLGAGMDKISGQFAVFTGSRYGFVLGYRVPLDDQDPLHAYPVRQNGEIYVPASFAAFLSLSAATPTEVPSDFLRDRYVYHLSRPAQTWPATVRTIQVDGKTYVDFADAAALFGLHFFQDDSGLACDGRKLDFDFTTHEVTKHDNVIMAFDMPEKFASNPVALKYLGHLPALVPVPKAPSVPRSAYNLNGFEQKLLGTKVPAPGVYPRLLFSPDDLPNVQARVKESIVMQMSMAEMEALFKNTWWNPATPDGQLFQKLIQGGAADYSMESRTQGIYSTDVNYPTNCLVSMALFCLLADDNEHGQQVATAICNYYQSLEPRVTEILASSQNEFAFVPALTGLSATNWKGVDKLAAHHDLGLALDFAGKWMTPGQIDTLRRVIAKATYGRRTTAGDGLSHLLATTAIEGLSGFDAEGYAADAELAQSFLDWGLDSKGQPTAEGVKTGNLQFQVLAMIVLARRGDNLWGHPHWRNFLTGAPASAYTGATATAGDPNDGGLYDLQTIMEFHAFYPTDKTADAILSQRHPGFNPANLDLTLFRAQLANETAAHMRGLKLRLPGVSYPGFVSPVLYDTDWKMTSTRGE